MIAPSSAALLNGIRLCMPVAVAILFLGSAGCCPDRGPDRVPDLDAALASVNTQLAGFRQGLDEQHHFRWQADKAIMAPDASAMKIYLKHDQDAQLRRELVLIYFDEKKEYAGRIFGDRRIDLPPAGPGILPPSTPITVPLGRL